MAPIPVGFAVRLRDVKPRRNPPRFLPSLALAVGLVGLTMPLFIMLRAMVNVTQSLDEVKDMFHYQSPVYSDWPIIGNSRLKRQQPPSTTTTTTMNDSVESIQAEFQALKRRSDDAKMNVVVETSVFDSLNDTVGVELALRRFSVESTQLYVESVGLLRRLCVLAEQDAVSVRPGLHGSGLAYSVLDAWRHHDAPEEEEEQQQKQKQEEPRLPYEPVASKQQELKLQGGLEKKSGQEPESVGRDLSPEVGVVARRKRSMDYFRYFTTGGGEEERDDSYTDPGMMMVPSRDMNQVPFYLRFRMPPHPNYHEYSPPDERPLLSANQRCLLGGISFVLVAAFGTAMYFCKPEEEKTGSRRGSVKKSAQTETAAQEDEQPAPEPEDLESLIE